jgi:undecaprenyl-diphosphatase
MNSSVFSNGPQADLERKRVAAVALSLGALFALLTAAATSGLTLSADTWLILRLGAGRSATPIRVMLAATWVASGIVAIPLALLLTMLLRHRGGSRLAWLYAAACLSGWALNILLKELTHRARPVGIIPVLTDAGFYSFPSGHAMMAALVFGFGALLLARTVDRSAIRMAIIGLGAAITMLVSLSRIYLGAHWPSDVLAALIAGAGWAATCTLVEQRWRLGAPVSAPEGGVR